jgi:hypothetical protein
MKLARERWINEHARDDRTWMRPFRALRSRSAVRARRAHAPFPYSAGLAAVALLSALASWLGASDRARRRGALHGD